jgi:hypothetical protein
VHLELLASQDARDPRFWIAPVYLINDYLAAPTQELGAGPGPLTIKLACVEIGRKVMLVIAAGMRSTGKPDWFTRSITFCANASAG